MAEEQEIGELETVAEEIQGEQESADQQGQQKPPEDDIPEKYRGKSVREIVSELELANKNMGRYANELGEVRRLADELIKSQLVQKPKEPEIQNEVDYFADPQEAIRRAVESNPKVQAAEQYAMQARREMAQQKFVQMHPDFQQIIQDQEFRNWVDSSPIRKQLFIQADSYDVHAANELFSTFKELKGMRQARTTEVDSTARKQAMTSAAVDTGGAGETPRKIYRRADLINLQIRNPAKFQAMQDEITRAYAEGRVK